MLFNLSSYCFLTDTDTDPPVQVFKSMLEMIPNPFYTIGCEDHNATIPRILKFISGPPCAEKKNIANRAFCVWQSRLKKKNAGKDPKACPFYQPSCQNMELRTFMGKLKAMYDFHYVLGDFKNFKGSLGGVMKTLYAQRFEKWVSLVIGNVLQLCHVE